MKIEIDTTNRRYPSVLCDDKVCGGWANKQFRCLICPFGKLIEMHADELAAEITELGYGNF